MRVVITENCCIDSRTLYSTNVWSSVCVAASAVLYVMLLLCYGSGLLVVAGALLLQRHVVPRALLGGVSSDVGFLLGSSLASWASIFDLKTTANLLDF